MNPRDEIEDFSSLKEINLSCNKIKGDAKMKKYLSAFIESLSKNSSLEKVDLCFSGIEGQINLFCQELNKSNQNGLKEIDLSTNDLKDEKLKLICESLKNDCPNLESLILVNNDLGSKSLIDLSRLLNSNNSLTFLNLIHNRVGESEGRGLHSFCKSFQCNLNSLKKLGLGQNSFGDQTIQVLSSSLKTNSTLKELDLSSNQFSSKGIKFLVDSIKKNSALKKLNLGSNKLDFESMKLICELIECNSSLDTLDLSNNLVNDEKMKILCESLQKSLNLTDLNLSGNDFSEKGVEFLSHLLEKNVPLSSLNLSSNTIREIRMLYLSNSLYTNSNLKHLDLSNNYFGDGISPRFTGK